MSYFKQSWRRWLAWLLLVVMFAVACSFLSRWQFARRAEVVAANNIVNSNYFQPAVPIDAVLKNGRFNPQREWHPVMLEGHYVSGSDLLVRNKPYAGNPGFLQVALFQTADLKLYLVDRGWLPTGTNHDHPDLVPTLPSGDIQIIARIRAAESNNGKSAPRGELAAIVPGDAQAELRSKEPIAEDFYLRLAAETPRSAVAPKLETKPELSEGNHLSYAIQWIIFAVLAFVTLVWSVRRELDFYRAANDPNYVPKPKRVTRAQRDNQAEDQA
ncbi:MAG: SURF1 family protein [Actinomycetales bacterium]|nr:SURF1 family protein [Actinomycetales bacterium]